jgi:hypothetical protein
MNGLTNTKEKLNINLSHPNSEMFTAERNTHNLQVSSCFVVRQDFSGRGDDGKDRCRK